MNDPKVFSVSDITRSIKQILGERQELKNIWIRGEISNVSLSGNGHLYFSLKDPGSIIKCNFFSYNYKNYKGSKIKDGLEVRVYGSVTVYEQGGQYNFNVARLEELGKGDLLYQIELLKQKLNAKGIFDPSKKKPIPSFIRTLGIATASNGAAVEDIIRIARERYPHLNITVAPCLVQGEQAPSSIVSAIRELNDPKWNVDVIIAGRGGGSFEDLMAFNHEDVIMAFYSSGVPIISAVGHQTDSVLSDFAADAYTPTPTAAAELAVPNIADYEFAVEDLAGRLVSGLRNRAGLARERYKAVSERHIFSEGKIMLQERILKTDETVSRIFLLGRNYLSKKNSDLQKFDKLKLLVNARLETLKKKYELTENRLENFSPLLTLKRGYSVLRNSRKEVISDRTKVRKGEILESILHNGRLKLEVLDTE